MVDEDSFFNHYDAETRTLALQMTVEPENLRGDVTLTVTRDAAELLHHEWRDAAFELFAPNGEACGPVCYSAGPLSAP